MELIIGIKTYTEPMCPNFYGLVSITSSGQWIRKGQASRFASGYEVFSVEVRKPFKDSLVAAPISN